MLVFFIVFLDRTAEAGHKEICAALIDAGADVNAANSAHKNSKAIWYAAENGHTDVVALLKERGAVVDDDASESGDYEFAGLNFDDDDE